MTATETHSADGEEQIREQAARLAVSVESHAQSLVPTGARKPPVLLTGFAPFGTAQQNPSQQVVERLHGRTIGGAEVVGLTLPVVFGQDVDRVTAAIADLRPRLVLSLGLAAGTTCVDVERFAVNLRYAGDLDPTVPVPANHPQTHIIEEGTAALTATVDAEGVAAAIRERAGVPARAHGYAGAYLCNHILYQTLHTAAQWDLSYKAGFLHLPLSSEQAIAENKVHLPSLPLDSLVRGVQAAIEEALT